MAGTKTAAGKFAKKQKQQAVMKRPASSSQKTSLRSSTLTTATCLKRPAASSANTPQKRRISAEAMTPEKVSSAQPQPPSGVYRGSKDGDGLPHGSGGTLKDDIGTYVGDFSHGVRQGSGVMNFENGHVLQGNFENGLPSGWCTLTEPGNQSVMRAEYVGGSLNGQAESRDQEGNLLFRGRFEDDQRTGMFETLDKYGGRVIGNADSEGDMSGENLMYVFPDGKTVLVGTFEDGEFVCGRYGLLRKPLSKPKICKPEESSMAEVEMPEHDLADDEQAGEVFRDSSASEPSTVPDLYEAERVQVKKVERAGTAREEGLFARVQIPAGEVCAWFAGQRLTVQEVDQREKSANQWALPLDAETVLDCSAEGVPTLGHMALHNEGGNAQFVLFEHPRFGLIKAITALKDIAPEDEISVDFSRPHVGGPQQLPAWFLDAHSIKG